MGRLGRLCVLAQCLLACGARAEVPVDAGTEDIDTQTDADVDRDPEDDVSCAPLPARWGFETPDPGAFGWPTLAVGEDDRPRTVYIGLDGYWRFAVRTDAGEWVTEDLPTDEEDRCFSLVVDGANAAHMLVLDQSSALFYASNETGSWILDPVSEAPTGSQASLGVGANGTIHVLFTDPDGTRITDAFRADGLWSSREVARLPAAVERIATAVAASGVAHVAFVTTDWKLFHGSDTDRVWSYRVLDEDFGGDDFVLVNISTTPRISFHGDDVFVLYHVPGELRWVELGPDGSTISESSMSTDGFVTTGDNIAEFSTSYWLQPPDTLYVTYVEETPAGRNIHCAMACLGEWHDEVAQHDALLASSPETWALLALGPTGAPHIAYSGSYEMSGDFFVHQPKYLHPEP